MKDVRHLRKRPWEIWYLAPWLIAHEACHYLAARLLGYQARLYLTRTDVFDEPVTWRSYVITLAQTIVGGLLLIALAALSVALHTLRWVLIGLLFNMGWQALCGRDFFACGIWPSTGHGPQRTLVRVQARSFGSHLTHLLKTESGMAQPIRNPEGDYLTKMQVAEHYDVIHQTVS